MHDANDAESLEDYYSGDTGVDYSDNDAADYEFIDNDSDDSDDIVTSRQQVNSSSQCQKFAAVWLFHVPLLNCKWFLLLLIFFLYAILNCDLVFVSFD